MQGRDGFIYRTEGDKKLLSRLEITRYGAAGSQDVGMRRGEQLGEVQVVNFDLNGTPDNLIPLWIYSDPND